MKDNKPNQSSKLDKLVSEANQNRAQRELSYRERALKMYPWVCGKCERVFDRKNLQELTVHHRDHDHDNNPEDGSNWELLCVYCHDNEHSRMTDRTTGKSQSTQEEAKHNPFAGLSDMLKNKDRS